MITASDLKNVLSYNPETGNFTWLITLSNRGMAGSTAGCLGPEYVHIQIHGTLYLAHRLAWLYMTGRWPKCEIDHKDINGHNNKWENLREATRTQNNRNRRTNRPLPKGVTLPNPNLKKPYRAVVRYEGKNRYLGYYATPEEAQKVYAAEIDRLHGEFARPA